MFIYCSARGERERGIEPQRVRREGPVEAHSSGCEGIKGPRIRLLSQRHYVCVDEDMEVETG